MVDTLQRNGFQFFIFSHLPTMHKTSYQNELTIPAPQRRGGSNSRRAVEKIQAWLSLYEMRNPGSGTASAIDGDFGPATERTVRAFQEREDLPATGVVDQAVFNRLCQPLTRAFAPNGTTGTLRERIVRTAQQHLQNQPSELVIRNQTNAGPWVRSYMDGHDGSAWLWCMGFVQTIIDQAASAVGKDFRQLMPVTFSCDTVGTVGLQKGVLLRSAAVRNDASRVQPGDVFLLVQSPHDWIHTGLIVNVGDETFETIEGNTNAGGSTNGTGVFRRVRNFTRAKLDVFSVESLT